MINYLKMGAEVLQDRMEEYGGVTVQYRRPGVFSFPIEAIPGRNPTDVIDQKGLVLRAQVQDFIVNIAKLKKAMSDPKRPLKNDEVVMDVQGEKVVYVVNAEDFATSHYEPADSYGVAWRIHSKSDRIE